MQALDSRDPSVPYGTTLDALSVISYMARADGVVTYVSHEWERLTGNDVRDVLKHGFQFVLHPSEIDRVVATWDHARERGLRYCDEFSIRFGDGSYRALTIEANPMRDDAGAIVGWIGTLIDVKALRGAQEALVRALEVSRGSGFETSTPGDLVERLLDASDDCIKILDLDGRLISMSLNGQKTFGIVEFAPYIGTSWVELWVGDERGAARAAVESARAGRRGKFTGFLEIAGMQTWWDVTVTPVLASDGRPERLLAVSRNVTETFLTNRALALSEERYRVLGEALPGITFTVTPDGLVDHIGGGLLSNRLPLPELLGANWFDTVHPDERDRVRARWDDAMKIGMPFDAQFRVRTAEGPYRWQLVRALAQRDELGAIVRWVGVNVDIDDQRRADEAREQLVRLVEASDDFIGVADENGRVTFVNEAGRKLAGAGSLEEACATSHADWYVAADRALAESEIMTAVKRDGRWIGEIGLRHFPTGKAIPMWHNIFALADEHGAPAGVATVSRDLRDRRRFEVGMRALAETGAAMYNSLDFEGTVRNVAEALVRSFATFCVVHVLEDDGSIRSVAASRADHSAVAVFERMAAIRTRDRKRPVARAIYDGESTLVSTLPDDWLETVGLSGADNTAIARFDARSILFVPVRSTHDNRIFGALTCILDGADQRGRYTAEDLRFAEEIAVRAALAFDHARAYERERRIAVTLQEASLPNVLPKLDGISLSADYRPGSSEATIGGDWYDAFLLDDGRLAITVGDVQGSGLVAAVTMGKVRQAMRSAATLIATPRAMLDVADRAVRTESADRYATALAGIYDPKSYEFTFASAGHPGPIIRHPDGCTEEVHSPGLLLGLRTPGEIATISIPTPPGSTVVFFTDGLIEATKDFDEGYRRVHAAIADANVTGADNPARALVEHVLGGPASDDIATLVLEIAPSARRATTAPALWEHISEPLAEGAAERALGATVLSLSARFEEVAPARAAMRTLLSTAHASPDALALIELAVGELVTNAINFGSGSVVELALRIFVDRACVAVTNDGPNFELADSNLDAMSSEESGRGLAMLAAFGCKLRVEASDALRCTVTASIPFDQKD